MGTAAAVAAHAVAIVASDVILMGTQTAAITAGHAAVAGAIAAAEASRISYDGVVGVAAAAQLLAQGIQLVRNYNDGVDALNERDLAIDKQIDFMQQLQDLKVNQDLPMLLRKKDVLTDLIIPTINFCYVESSLYTSSDKDGDAVDSKSGQLSRQSRGSPSGWLMHDGQLKGAKTAGYTQGIERNAEKRRIETLRKSKTRLVRSAQATLKSEYSSAEILTKYAQAANIHGGIADLYMQGFNSAGAAFGVALGRLSSPPTNTGGEGTV